MPVPRIMAIDYGDARTGVAISDATGMLAGYTTVVPSRKEEAALEELCRLIKDHGVEQLVVGLPRNMDGSEGPRANLCREFSKKLEIASGLPAAMWDERLTSVEAHAILHTGGKKMKQHRKTVDAVAASLILEGYLAKARRGQT